MKKLKTSLIILLGLVIMAERSTHGQAPATSAKPKSAKGEKASKPKKTPPKKASKNVAALISDLEKSNAFILKSATVAKLSSKEKKQIPFFSGLKTIEKNVDLMKKSSTAKSTDFFKQMDETGKAFVQVNSTVRMLRVKDKDTLDGVRALGTAYNELQMNYGRNAARKKQGGALTSKESAQLVKLRTDIKKLDIELAKLKAKIKSKKDPELLLRFDECSKNARKVGHIKGDSLTALLEVTEIVDLFYYEWSALGETCEYWYPDVYTEWTTTNTSFDSYFEYYEESYSSWEVSDWSYMEASYDVVDSVETYDVEISESEVSSIETTMESYEESSATEESTEVDTSSEVSEEDSYELEDDEDGDGLEDSEDSDDDGDGSSDAEDTDDDGDGVNDDDEDGDGTPDETDTDDDGDGTADTEDMDDDGDGVDDSDEAEDDGGGDEDSSDDGGDEEASDDGGDEEASDDGGADEGGDDEASDDSGDDGGGDDGGGDDGGGDDSGEE